MRHARAYRQQRFKLSSDPLCVEKVRDIVGLSLDPPLKAMVLCVDEKRRIQALERTQPLLPLAPGIPELRTHDLVRGAGHRHRPSDRRVAPPPPQCGVPAVPAHRASQRAQRGLTCTS